MDNEQNIRQDPETQPDHWTDIPLENYSEDQLVDDIRYHRAQTSLKEHEAERWSQMKLGQKVLDTFSLHARKNRSQEDLENILENEQLISETEKEFVNGLVEGQAKIDNHNRTQIEKMMNNRSTFEKYTTQLKEKTILGVSIGGIIVILSKGSPIAARVGGKHLVEILAGASGSTIGAAVVGGCIGAYRTHKQEVNNHYRASSKILLKEIESIHNADSITKLDQLTAMEKVITDKVSSNNLAEAIILQSRLDRIRKEIIASPDSDSDLESLPQTMSEKAQNIYLEIIQKKNRAIKQATIRGAIKGTILGGVIGAAASLTSDYLLHEHGNEAILQHTEPIPNETTVPETDVTVYDEIGAAQTIYEHKTEFIAEVQQGDGYTHLARRTIHDYLVNIKNLRGESFQDLNPAQRIYAEDYLRRIMQANVDYKPLLLGSEPIGTSVESIQEAVEKARSLTETQLHNIDTQYVSKITQGIWDRLDLSGEQENTFFFDDNWIDLSPLPEQPIIQSELLPTVSLEKPDSRWLDWISGATCGVLGARGALSIAKLLHNNNRQQKLANRYSHSTFDTVAGQEKTITTQTEQPLSEPSFKVGDRIVRVSPDGVVSLEYEILEIYDKDPQLGYFGARVRDKNDKETGIVLDKTIKIKKPILMEKRTVEKEDEDILSSIKESEPSQIIEEESQEKIKLESYATTIAKLSRFDDNEDNHIYQPEIGLFGVFDGLGGHDSPREASRDAVEIISNKLNTLSIESGTAAVEKSLQDAFQEANDFLIAQAEAKQDKKSRATTASVVKVWQDTNGIAKATIANIGDSRVYLRRIDTNEIISLTVDDGIISHTYPTDRQLQRYLQEKFSNITTLKQILALTKDERELWDNRHRISKCLGSINREKKVTPIIFTINLQPKDRLIITSDGVHDNLTDKLISEIAVANPSAQETASLIQERAFDIANIAGAPLLVRSKPDDITAIVIDIKSEKSQFFTTEKVKSEITDILENRLLLKEAQQKVLAYKAIIELKTADHSKESEQTRLEILTWFNELFNTKLQAGEVIKYELAQKLEDYLKNEAPPETADFYVRMIRKPILNS